MKRIYALYAISLTVLLLIALVGVRLSQFGSISSALRALSRGEREYQEARRGLLLSARNPVLEIISFARDRGQSKRARMRALSILNELSFQQETDTLGRYLVPILDDPERDIVLAGLETLGYFKTLDGSEKVAGLYRSSDDSAVVHRSYSALKASAETMARRLDEALAARDSAAIDSCLQIMEPLPAQKAGMFMRLASHYRSTGDMATAASYYRRMGIVKKWWALGAFENRRMEGMYKDYGPESKPFNPVDSFVVNDTTKAGWFPLKQVDPDGTIDLRRLFVRQTHAVAYLFTYLHAPEDMEARLYIGSDDGPRVWCNGELIWSMEEFRPCIPDNDVAVMHLRKGANELLVKVSQEMGGWNMVSRIGDEYGNGIPGLIASLSAEMSREPVEQLIARGTKRSVNWGSLADSLDVEDEGMVATLLAVVTDLSRTAAERTAALSLLDEINLRRMVPAGEGELLAYAEQAVKRGADGVLAEVVDVLISMKTSKALDVGLRMRQSADPAMQRRGNRLVSLYCRKRILALGDIRSTDRRAEIERVVGEVASLQPTGRWVLERMAAFYDVVDDTVGLLGIRPFITMPKPWLGREVPKERVGKAHPSAEYSELRPPDGALEADKAPEGWRRLSWGDESGAVIWFSGMPEWFYRRSDRQFVLHSQVFSPETQRLVVYVSLPAPHRFWFNGALAGSTTMRESARYSSSDVYRWRPEDMDMREYEIEMKKGLNTVEIQFAAQWYQQRGTRYVQVGFADLAGRPMGCDGFDLGKPMGRGGSTERELTMEGAE